MSELANQENSMYQQKKIDLFQGIIPSVNLRIKRELNDFEIRAIAFVVDEVYQESEIMTTDQFLEKKLGVQEEDNPREASWHIYESIYHAKQARLNREKEASLSDSEKISWFNILAGIMQTGYAGTQSNYKNSKSIVIGAVMDEWVPQWFSNLQTA